MDAISEEMKVVSQIEDALQKSGVSTDRISLQRKAKAYITIMIDGIFDFCRVHIGAKSSYIALWLSNSKKKNLQNDTRCSDFNNIGQNYWRFKILDVNKIAPLSDLLEDAINRCMNEANRAKYNFDLFTPEEKLYCKEIVNILINNKSAIDLLGFFKTPEFIRVDYYYPILDLKIGKASKWIQFHRSSVSWIQRSLKKPENEFFSRTPILAPAQIETLTGPIISVFTDALLLFNQNKKYITEQNMAVYKSTAVPWSQFV